MHSANTLHQVIAPNERIKLHLTAFIAVLFLAIYGRLVCPFIEDLRWQELFAGLIGVAVIQITLREWAYSHLPIPVDVPSLARFGHYLSVITWIASGMIAFFIHALLYPSFPLASHLKLMVGYFALGAGMLSYLEYAYLERLLRRDTQGGFCGRRDQLTWRLLESFTAFTLVPGIAVSLMLLRIYHEGFVIGGVVFELLFLVLFFMFIAQLVAWYWGQTLRDDTARIVSGLERISSGSYDVSLDATRSDELGEVAGGINQMAIGLAQRERIRDAFGRFVSPQVAERFIREHVHEEKEFKLGGDRRTVTVLMCDIRGFTPLSQQLDPQQLTSLLNQYFAEMVAAIGEHGGMVDKFIGDAVMAVFGLTDEDPNPASSALAAACSMRERLVQLNHRLREQGQPALDNGIGLHTGEVVAGYLGSPNRMEFTVIGHTVNVAARIESVSKAPNPPLLLSATTAALVADAVPLESIGKVMLKGVDAPMELFTPRLSLSQPTVTGR